MIGFKKAGTMSLISFPVPNALIKAEPMMAPLVYSAAMLKLSLSLIPKPTSIGLLSL